MVFQHVPTEELDLLNSSIQPGSCQGSPAYEEAEADALATSPRPAWKYPSQMFSKDQGRTKVKNTTDKAAIGGISIRSKQKLNTDSKR